VSGWRGGATVGRRTYDQEVASSIRGQARPRTTTLGKLLTAICLDADIMESFTVVCVRVGRASVVHKTGSRLDSISLRRQWRTGRSAVSCTGNTRLKICVFVSATCSRRYLQTVDRAHCNTKKGKGRLYSSVGFRS